MIVFHFFEENKAGVLNVSSQRGIGIALVGPQCFSLDHVDMTCCGRQVIVFHVLCHVIVRVVCSFNYVSRLMIYVRMVVVKIVAVMMEISRI